MWYRDINSCPCQVCKQMECVENSDYVCNSYNEWKKGFEVERTIHAHWIPAEGIEEGVFVYGPYHYRCSNCKKILWLCNEDKFCKNCGSKMDEKIE